MRQNNDEIEKRLVRIAWKCISPVIELNEQKYMEKDPEYASAINRLHICNVHLMMSDVSTNTMRTPINMKKAEAITRNPSNLNLILCSGYGTISSELVSILAQIGALPTFIP